MDTSDRKLVESLFAGNGEMATRMRTLDWSTTALGPVEQWPQALRTCVRLMLGSDYPMTICGGQTSRTYTTTPMCRWWEPNIHGRWVGRCREVYPEAWILLDRCSTE